jgi:hypothetical protein
LELSSPGGSDGPSLSDENDDELFSMFLDVDKLNFSCALSSEAKSSSIAAIGVMGHGMRPKHQHNQSMDESMSIKAEECPHGNGGDVNRGGQQGGVRGEVGRACSCRPEEGERSDFASNCSCNTVLSFL